MDTRVVLVRDSGICIVVDGQGKTLFDLDAAIRNGATISESMIVHEGRLVVLEWANVQG